MTELMLEMRGPDGLFAIFSEDEGAGYFYIYKSENQEVLAQICIYESRQKFAVQESDIEVMWSTDYKKSGVAIWGQMRGIINPSNGEEKFARLEDHNSPGITDVEWLKGFDNYLDQNQFIRARQRYWKEMVKQHDNIEPRPEQETPIETNFIRFARGPASWFAVFEDDGTTGYLYLYSSEERKVTRHLHLYDRSEKLGVTTEDVRVMWSERCNKCGVAIWGKMRGIIDIEKGQEGRVWLNSPQTPGIGDSEWLRGF